MKAQKQKSNKKAKVRQINEKNDFKAKIKILGERLSQIEKKEFWYSHLPWPRFLRKPKIRFVAPRINWNFPIPNRMIMFVIALFIVGFSLAGGAYDLVSKTTGKIAIGYDTSTQPATPIFFYSGLHDQFFLEGIIAFSLISLGFVGFLFIHQSTKHFYRPKHSYFLLCVGIGLLLIAFITMNMIIENGKNINMFNP
ncbi:MAG: hypothetical protein ACTSRS_18455 [Candidatus Helarchaeota archaeon]